MKITTDEIKMKRKLYLALAVSGAVLYAIYCILLVPISGTVGSDIRYEGTALPELLNFLCRFFEVAAIAVTCGVTALGVIRFRAKGFALGGVVYCGLVLYKYAISIILGWAEKGRIPSEWLFDIVFVLVASIVEIIPFVIAWIFIAHFAKNYAERRAILKKAGRDERFLPMKKLFDKDNPLVAAALVCSAVVLVTKIAAGAVYDVPLIISSGLPTQTSTVIQIVLYYVSSVVFAVVCYFVMLLTMTLVGTKIVKGLDL